MWLATCAIRKINSDPTDRMELFHAVGFFIHDIPDAIWDCKRRKFVIY